jgi:transcriptional regulator with XRE-family HTH domain
VTDQEFRGWVREWFKDQVRDRAEDVDRRFARMVKLSSTEVNHIVNDKRYPTWKQIAKVTESLDVRADEFLLDIVRRARLDYDSRASVSTSPTTPLPGVVRPRSESERREAAARAKQAQEQAKKARRKP